MLSLGNNRSIWLLLSIYFTLCNQKGQTGFACLSNPCIHGICVDDLNSTYSCYCIDGYTGIQCQTNWDECWSNPCQNGGICHDGIADFNCSCTPGFVGDLCEEDYNECDSNPCVNNGTCIDGTNGYNCFCSPGYSGTHCEIDIAVCNATNETRCGNGGMCEEGPGVSFSCHCKPGWGGFLCESEIDECLSTPCQNGAICIDLHADYSCACLFGYTGKNCEEIMMRCEKNRCKNGALCLTEEGHPVCYCVPDYHGDQCQYQYDECQLGPRCMNGGTCIDGVDSFSCSCPPNLTGVLCECLIINKDELDCTYTFPPINLTTQTSLKTEYTKMFSDITSTSEEWKYTTLLTQVPNISTITAESIVTSTVPSTEITVASSEMDLQTMLTTIYNNTDKISSTFSIITSTTIEEISTAISLTETTYETTTQDLAQVTITPSAIETTKLETTMLQDSTTTTLETKNATSRSTQEVPTTLKYTDTTLLSTLLEKSTISLQTEPSTTWIEQTTLPIEITASSSAWPSLTTAVSIATMLTNSPGITVTPREDTTLTISSSTTEWISYDTSTPYSSQYTTISRENATKSIFLDCSESGHFCKNGGTCLYAEEGYRCSCPHDAEGPFCEFKLGVVTPAFSGNSYLTHRLVNTSEIKIEFKAKTLSPSGLLFYSNIESNYVALYLEKGYLKFIFSCGYQTMLLSELKKIVNDGFEIKIITELQFSQDLKLCNASLTINGTLKMSGQQIAIINPLIKPISFLHLGGLPQEKFKDGLPIAGFTGCMKDLKIFDKKINVFREAEDSYKISECASLACLSNPCNNEGTCIENNDIWYCNCKNGFLGKFCEKSVCDNNPCLYGATCLPFAANGYICLCPFGKHGHYCENDLEISEPYFSSSIRGYSSFAAYTVPSGGISNNMELKFKFSPVTNDQISILIFVGQISIHDAFSDHLAISYVKGYIMLTWNLGSGPRRIFTSKPLENDKQSHWIHIGLTGRRAWLAVEGMGNITGRSPGNLVELDVAPVIYLGGHSSPNFSILPHDLPLHTGFSGCIFDVELRSGNLIVPLQSSRQVVGRSLGQCNTNECHKNLCQNEGACLHHGATFTCLCQDGWYGPLCSLKYNSCNLLRNNCSVDSNCVPLLSGYECDCPIGKSGNLCEKYETLSDISLTGKRSYVTIHSKNFGNFKFSLYLEIRPLGNQGLVLFIGREENSFLSLNLHGGILELRILPAKRKLNNNVISLRSNKLLSKGLWYAVKIKRFGSKLQLSVDDVTNTAYLNHGEVLNLSDDYINLGGIPDMSKLPTAATSSIPTRFVGCIRQLKVDNLHIPLTSESIINGQNVVDCDGTPCGSDTCLNGGTCWLDSQLKPHCNCIDPYGGDTCEIITSCEEKPCKNKGICRNSQCSCLIGYAGAYCERVIQITVPEFYGTSHLLIKRERGDKKRDLRGATIKNMYLNFTTVDLDGLLLLSNNTKGFLGIGIDDGFIKLIYINKNTKKKTIELLPSKPVNDGRWHCLEIFVHPTQLEIVLDKKNLIRNSKHNIKTLDSISLNDDFYLGGLPLNYEILNETIGTFSSPFLGCLNIFGLNDEKFISGISDYYGENIGSCTI